MKSLWPLLNNGSPIGKLGDFTSIFSEQIKNEIIKYAKDTKFYVLTRHNTTQQEKH